VLNKGCLSIYDEKCSIDDFNGVVAINENGGEPEIVDMGRNDESSQQRIAIDLATQVSDGTRTIPAFPAAVDMVLESALTMSSDTYLLYITDGMTWDANLFYKRKVNIEKVNSKRRMKIHVIAIGLEIEDQDIVEQIQRLVGGIRDPLSTYLEARRDNLGAILKRAGEMISSRGTNRVELGVTMEKF
jgi:uncharacterized protein YqgV (UPF0045/DUF77 family)